MTEHFSNRSLAIHQLPTLKELSLHPLDHNYVKIAVIQALAGLVFPLAIFAAFFGLLQMRADEVFVGLEISHITLVLLAFSFLLFCALSLALIIKSAKMKAYGVREHDIAFKEGLLFKKLVIQPLPRVQHVEVSQNPLESRLGLATLKLYSAGGFRHTFAIPGLSKEDAERIHQHVLSYQESSRE